MITGYNTDTKHDGVVYHVQTEDGGVDNPFVVTLVYRGGRILASKKSGYAELLGTPDLVNRVRIILEKQHRLMMAAVNAGALAAGGKLEARAAAALQRDGLAKPLDPPVVPPVVKPVVSPVVKPAIPPVAVKPPPPAVNPAQAGSIPPLGQSTRPAPPAPAPAKPSHDEKSLDQVILEFLASELGKK